MPPRRARHPPFFLEAGFAHGFAEKNFCSTPNAAISCGECGPKKHASNFPDVEEEVSSQITETKKFLIFNKVNNFKKYKAIIFITKHKILYKIYKKLIINKKNIILNCML